MSDTEMGIIVLLVFFQVFIVSPVLYFRFYREKQVGVEFKGKAVIKFFILFSFIPTLVIIVIGILISDVRDLSGILLLTLLPLAVCILTAAMNYIVIRLSSKYIAKKPAKFE